VIPAAILAAAILTAFVRWWAVPIVAAGWGVVIATSVEHDAFLAAVAVGAANAAIGTAAATVWLTLLRAATGRPVRSSARNRTDERSVERR
jgi:hypothetical protein